MHPICRRAASIRPVKIESSAHGVDSEATHDRGPHDRHVHEADPPDAAANRHALIAGRIDNAVLDDNRRRAAFRRLRIHLDGADNTRGDPQTGLAVLDHDARLGRPSGIAVRMERAARNQGAMLYGHFTKRENGGRVRFLRPAF